MDNLITLRFDAKTLDYIANVLGARPWAEANPVLVNITQQVQAQQQAQPILQQGNGASQPEASPAH